MTIRMTKAWQALNDAQVQRLSGQLGVYQVGTIDGTVSFIGLKKGLFTASGKACCGEVSFNGLQVPASVYESVEHEAELLAQPSQWSLRVNSSVFSQPLATSVR